MAVETAKSALITARDAVPPTAPKVVEAAAGPLKSVYAKVTVAVSASSASRYIFCSVPSNARLRELKVMCTTLGSDTTMDFGLWKTAKDGSAVVDQDRLASALVVGSPIAESSYNNVLSESADTAFTDLGKPLWELLGLSTDPGLIYDVCSVIMHVNGAEVGGTVAIDLLYV